MNMKTITVAAALLLAGVTVANADHLITKCYGPDAYVDAWGVEEYTFEGEDAQKFIDGAKTVSEGGAEPMPSDWEEEARTAGTIVVWQPDPESYLDIVFFVDGCARIEAGWSPEFFDNIMTVYKTE